METHLNRERFSSVADGSEFLTSEEVSHLEHCSDCVEAMAERIRERIQLEDSERPA
jgi:hypothetical protein